MNAKDLFALSPFGAIIAYSDGQPKPRAHAKRKLREWSQYNGQGRYASRLFGTITHNSFGIMTEDSDTFTVVRTHMVESTLSFEVIEDAQAGAILLMQGGDRSLKMRHYFESESNAYEWAARNRYSLARLASGGSRFVKVSHKGELLAWTPLAQAS